MKINLLIIFVFLISGLGFILTPVKVQAQYCACTLGATSDQGCGIGVGLGNGCAVGERRLCACGLVNGGGCQIPPIEVGPVDWTGNWNCTCTADASCGGGAPPPAGSCPDGYCNNGETGCTCGADCGTCNYVAACTWSPNNPIGCTGDGVNRQYVAGVPTRPGCCNGLVENWQGTCGCPVCNVAAPTAPILTAPANNSTIPSNSTTLSWNANGGWGTGCPSSNYQYKVFTSENCTSTYVNSFTLGSGTTSQLFSNLRWGAQYCWYVQKANGSLSANSPVWRFVVNNNPILTLSSFGADTCGYGITGRSDSISPNKVNPLTINVGFTDPEANTLSAIIISVVPQSALNINTVTYDQVYAASINNNTVTSMLGYATAGVLTSTWGWNMQSGGANATNTPGTVTLIGAGTTSKANYISPGNWTASVSFRFENSYPSGVHNVYATATVLNPDGTYSTPNQGNSSLLYMTKVGTWNFDMSNPAGSITLSNYVGSNFTAAWAGSDASGLKSAYSYIIASSTGTTLTDTTGGFAINPLGTTDMNYPTASNAGIGVANLPTSRVYNFTGVSDYTLKLALEDRACNVYTATAGAVIPSPWLYSREGVISANGGVSNIKIPAVASTNIPNFLTPTDATGVTIFQSENRIDLSTNSAMSGNGSLPTPVNTISTVDEYAYNYNNQATSPDSRANIANWYSYVLDLVTQNGVQVLTDPTAGALTKSGNISSYLDSLRGSASNATTVYAINVTNGSLNLNGITCDRRVILLSSNAVTITPDIKRSGTGGCIFVSAAGFNVASGTAKTPTTLAAGGNSSYDVLEGFFISGTNFVSPVDTSRGATFQYDGLIVKGGVLTSNTTLARNLNGSGNADQPAIIFQYDPFYALTFKDALATRFYTIREYIP